jgi:predicted ATPase
LEKIRLYREWSFGRKTALRLPQPTDAPEDFLVEDASNLGIVLNNLEYRSGDTWQTILEHLRRFCEGFEDVSTRIQGGTVQLFLRERGVGQIPASRLSDGTLRYLCLLAILCHPEPPPLVCIEEPELGLHPDAIPAIADMLKIASQRTQLIVTTHSDGLIDALSDEPEDVIVCEKEDGRTVMRRLDGSALSVWLEKYSLGQLWRRGDIGGNRW